MSVDTDDSRLLPLEEAKKLPFSEYIKYARGVIENVQHCGYEVYPKFEEWCDFLCPVSELSGDRKCVEPTPSDMSKSIISGITEPTSTQSNELSVLQTTASILYHPKVLESIGRNGTCYDSFWCESRSWVGIEHILAILAILCCSIAFILHILFTIPALNLHANQSGCTLLLTVLCVFDIIYMALFSWIFVWPHLASTDYIISLSRYASHVAPSAPYVLPLTQAMELLPLWILVILLVDRFLYLKYGLYSKRAFSRYTSLKMVAAFFAVILIYTVPKFFMYTSAPVYWKTSNNQEMRASSITSQTTLLTNAEIETKSHVTKEWYAMYHTKMGTDSFFFNLMTHWLKVPLEMFLPQMGILTMVLLVSYRLSLDTWRRTMRWKTTSAAAKSISMDFNTHVNGISQQISDPANVTIPLQGSPVRCAIALAEAREMANARMVVFLGVFACGSKIPKFILHILLTEDVNENDITPFFNARTSRPNFVTLLQLACILMDIAFVVVKPFLFLSLGSHLREALMLQLCGRESSVSAPLRTALLHTSHELRNMELKAVEEKMQCTDEDMEDKAAIPLCETSKVYQELTEDKRFNETSLPI